MNDGNGPISYNCLLTMFLTVFAHPLWTKFGTNSSSPAVVGGQQRLISGASLFILSAIPWKGGMGNRAPLAASLILFHIWARRGQ
jgi:hypothetical protein